jgi:hypothetical protein
MEGYLTAQRMRIIVPTIMRTLSCTLALALVCVAPCASAQLYKWVDADGVINYGDWPPPGVKIQSVTHGTVSVVAGGPKIQPGETRARSEERRNQRNTRDADGAPPAQVALDDGQYADAYAADYGYPARRARRAEAALDRPRPEPQIAQPGPALNLPAVREMPLPVRR